MSDELLEELIDWLRIPSVSTGGGDAAGDRARGGVGARARPRAPAATASWCASAGGNPLAVGELRAADPAAPTVLIYGHYDVQGAGAARAVELARRSSRDPRRPPLRARRGRRQGQLPAAAARRLRDGARRRAAGQRARADRGRGGDRRRGGRRLGARRRAAARCAIVFDCGMPDPQTPGDHRRPARHRDDARSTCAPPRATCTPGCTAAACSTRCTSCTALLAAGAAGADGRLREELRVGRPPAVARPSSPPGSGCPPASRCDRGGRRPPGLPRRRRASTTCATAPTPRSTSTRSHGGEPRTVVPADARASISLRLAPRQDPRADARDARAAAARARCPPAPSSSSSSHGGGAGAVRPRPAGAAAGRGGAAARLRQRAGLRCARAAASRSSPRWPARGYPVIVGGFGLPDDAHPRADESYSLQSLAFGEAAARELYPRSPRFAAERRGDG